MTVEGNLSFGLHNAGVAKVEIQRKWPELQKFFKSNPVKRKPSELSGGQRQRVD